MNIIAEFGVNWKTVDQADFMMGQAMNLRIKHIKFQLWKPEQVPEEVRTMHITKSIAKHFVELGKYYGQEVFFTCYYPEAIEICKNLDVNFYKVRYNDRRNLSLLTPLIDMKKKIFVSCFDPRDTIYHLHAQTEDIVFLRCDPHYPSKSIIPYIKEWAHHGKGIKGFSDHTTDLKLYKSALESGMEWFEVHVCLDKETAYEGKWSKTFEELKEVLK